MWSVASGTDLVIAVLEGITVVDMEVVVVEAAFGCVDVIIVVVVSPVVIEDNCFIVIVVVVVVAVAVVVLAVAVELVAFRDAIKINLIQVVI